MGWGLRGGLQVMFVSELGMEQLRGLRKQTLAFCG